jgi:hypothetical protein
MQCPRTSRRNRRSRRILRMYISTVFTSSSFKSYRSDCPHFIVDICHQVVQSVAAFFRALKPVQEVLRISERKRGATSLIASCSRCRSYLAISVCFRDNPGVC